MKDGLIEVKHCCIDEQLIDVFTKALHRIKFELFCEGLGVCEFSDQGEHVEDNIDQSFSTISFSAAIP